MSMMGKLLCAFESVAGRERERRDLLWIHLEKRRQDRGELDCFSTLQWVGEGEMKPSFSHEGTEKEQEAAVRRDGRRSSCLVVRKREIPVKLLDQGGWQRGCEISSL